MSDLTLYAEGLLSRWGFGDGDVVDDWWWEVFDEPAPDEALEELVEQLLLPVLTEHGHTFEAYRIGTIHNPIRLRVLDGEPVDVYADADNRQLDEIYVTITPLQAQLALKPAEADS
jgi:hypothetical protein